MPRPDAPTTYPPERVEALHRAAGDALDNVPGLDGEAAEALSDAMTHLRVAPTTLAEAVDRCAVVRFDSEDFHRHLATIQAILGQPDGDYAAAFFAGMDRHWNESTPDLRGDLLAQYIHGELRS